MPTMSEDEVLQKLQTVFRDEFDNPTLVLTPQMTSTSIAGWDSHKQVEIILACEDAFGVRLKPREINVMENVGEMVKHLAKVVNR